MFKATVLIISSNAGRCKWIAENLGNSFYLLNAATEEEAINRFLIGPVNLVIFGNDLEPMVKTKLTKLFKIQQADTIFVNDIPAINLGPFVLKKINQYQKENKPALAFIDDALQNAGLGIQLQ